MLSSLRILAPTGFPEWPIPASAFRYSDCEDGIGTKPYQWDRMLLHLRYAGVLDGVRGIVFGDMRQCVSAGEEEFLERAILHALRDFEGPIAIGLRCGHVDGANVTLPLGVRVRLDLTEVGNPAMHFLEAAVTV